MQSMLTLMWFEDQPPVAYSEALQVGKVHDAPAIVDRLQSAYYLALGDALSFQQSLVMLRETAREYGHHD